MKTNDAEQRTDRLPIANRTALITGASSGLGAHFARVLASDGIGTLALAARRTDRLRDVCEDCIRLGAGRVIVLQMDVLDAESIASSFATLLKGERRLDILVNNAGIAEAAPALETTLASFDKVMGVNLRGAWACAVEAARIMETHGGGDILNIASITGLRVANNLATYAMSKAGVVQMTQALALEWARHGIRVNALAPGYFETEINAGFLETEASVKMVKRIPARRLGRPEELDAPFRLLAYGQSTYLTGAVLTVDGGHSVNSL